jgi:hypothetical protein
VRTHAAGQYHKGDGAHAITEAGRQHRTQTKAECCSGRDPAAADGDNLQGQGGKRNEKLCNPRALGQDCKREDDALRVEKRDYKHSRNGNRTDLVDIGRAMPPHLRREIRQKADDSDAQSDAKAGTATITGPNMVLNAGIASR